MKKKPTEKRFNWLTRLRQLVAGNVKNPRDINDLYRRAGNWPTCACGTLCRRLPRDVGGRPCDLTLMNEGLRFYRAIKLGEWQSALTIFRNIEERTALLLKAS